MRDADWKTCSERDCGGVALADASGHCVRHADEEERAIAKVAIAESGILDLRGVSITADLLDELVGALPRDGDAHLASTIDARGAVFVQVARFTEVVANIATFRGARFLEDADFTGSVFSGPTDLSECEFCSRVLFDRAHFRDALLVSNTRFAGDLFFRHASCAADVRFTDCSIAGRSSFIKTAFARVTFGNTTFRDVAMYGAEFHGDARFGGSHFLGRANFDSAIFRGEARFASARFDDGAVFTRAEFESTATFRRTRFAGSTSFGRVHFRTSCTFAKARFEKAVFFSHASFSGRATFTGTVFNGRAEFHNTTFSGVGNFQRATFNTTVSFVASACSSPMSFSHAVFGGSATFARATLASDVSLYCVTCAADLSFDRSNIERVRRLGPLLVLGTFSLDDARLAHVATVDIAARRVSARHATFGEGVVINARWAEIALDSTVFGGPSLVMQGPRWGGFSEAALERACGKGREMPRLLSLRHSDVNELALAYVDLRGCRFARTTGLDKLALDPSVLFHVTPPATARRRAVAEEFIWRGKRKRRVGVARWRRPTPPGAPEWIGRVENPDAAGLSTIYRSLRKGLEDKKDAPGAADFYYGEMEMRRHAPVTPWVERQILTLYWAISGYGLRASRAVFGLAGLILISAAALDRFDLRHPWASATPDGYWSEVIWSLKAATRVIGGWDADVTTGGEVVQALLRLVGPLLIALALLAVRGRVKR